MGRSGGGGRGRRPVADDETGDSHLAGFPIHKKELLAPAVRAQAALFMVKKI